MKKIYVGMALADAPVEFRDEFQLALKTALRQLPEVEVLDFVGVENGTATEVFLHDRACTEAADLCVFITDYPSTGMGMEIWIRHMTEKPMILFAKAEKKVSRMLSGFAEDKEIPLVRYNTVADILAAVKAVL